VIQNYPGESPKVTCSSPETDAKRVNITGPFHVWDGIDIYGCYNGINLHASNVKILNSKIHNNILFGIVFVTNLGAVTGIEIAGNTVEANGYVESENCTVGVATSCTAHTLGGNPISPKDSHGIYLSNSACGGIDGVHIHDNTTRHHGGRGIQLNGLENGDGSPCAADGIKNVVIESNDILDGSWGISLFYGWANVQIIDNTFELNSWPTTNDTDHTFIGVWGANGLEVLNNVFSSSSSSMRPYMFFDNTVGCPTDDLDENTWDVNTDNWMWNNGGRSDFSSAFESVTGCGANDIHL
jgi:hypothetical protein